MGWPSGSPNVFRAVVDASTDAIVVLDAQAELRYANPAALALLGERADGLHGRNLLVLVHPMDRERIADHLDETLRTPGPRPPREFRIAADGAEWRPVEARAVNLLDEPDVGGILLTVRDVTDRANLTRALRTLGEGNLVLVSAPDERDLLQRMCSTINETGQYRLAWVGMCEEDEDCRVAPVASAGAVGYLDEIRVSWAESNPLGQGPTGRAIRSGTVQVVDDFRTDSTYLPWRDVATAYGFRTSCVLPLRAHGSVIGALCIYAGDSGAFDPESVGLLEKLAAAISYGIERLRDGQRLSRSLDATLEALASLTEKRDPYTAGHMSRVGVLASAIATELGLSDHESHGIRIAADLHDVGKIVIPAEILTRPSTLSVEEYALVKLHSRAGYDVVAGIDFPWPVATMVLQHHERLDGSGYPAGLRGDEILLGSRVLAVADTVEAMTNHRPYRPSIGLDQALETVRAGSGTVFDPEAVKACVALWEADRFSFGNGTWVLPDPRVTR